MWFCQLFRRFVPTILFLTILSETGSCEPDRTIVLTSPIECVPGRNCFIQNYVDLDSTTGVRDYSCGSKTYDGHKGTDFRLISTAEVLKPYDVVSAAPGRVKAVRDGMRDRLFRAEDRKRMSGRECGNGVVVDHGSGWETQYCHLKNGSLSVRKGGMVERGEVLGHVGFSGMANFAHLHFALRHNGLVVDPFSGLSPQSSESVSDCKISVSTNYWRDRRISDYGSPRSILIQLGFSSEPVKNIDLEQGQQRPASQITPSSPVLILFARFINLQGGDRIRLRISGPDGFKVQSNDERLERAKAQYTVYAGKRLKKLNWPSGVYEGKAELIRNESIVFVQNIRQVVE